MNDNITVRFEQLDRPVLADWRLRLVVQGHFSYRGAEPVFAHVGDQPVHGMMFHPGGLGFVGYLADTPRAGDALVLQRGPFVVETGARFQPPATPSEVRAAGASTCDDCAAALEAAPKGGGGLAGVGGAIGGTVLEVVGDQAKVLLQAGGLEIEGPEGAAVIEKGTDPGDYRPPGPFADNMHYVQVRLNNLGNDGPGDGLKALLEIEWMDNCHRDIKGASDIARQKRSIWYKKGIVAKASAGVGNAVGKAKISMHIINYNVDNNVAPPRAMAAISLTIAIEPKTALGTTLGNTLLVPLDPFSNVDYRVDYDKAGPPFLVMRTVPRTP